jgi:hypothetical protein
MANWVDNYIVISHKNKRKMEAFVRKCEKEMKENNFNFFNKIANERAFIRNVDYDGFTIKLCIDSAWNEVEDTLNVLTSRKYGFTLESGTYYECGMNFCGYHGGDSFEDFETLDGIPADIIANHGMAENWEEDHGTEQECE